MKKIGIIGGGPIGLYLAGKLEENNIDYILFEANDYLGGQINNLYPHKTIVDLPGIPAIIAKDYLLSLIDEINLNNVHLNEEIINIKEEKDSVILQSKKDEYKFDYVVIATGLGFYKPRTMGLESEDKASNILYSIKDFSFLKDKKVAIFGGGDSALDWAKEISAISNFVTLVHRRYEFRGNPETIKNCNNLTVKLSYVPYALNVKDDKAISIQIKKVEDDSLIEEIEVDYILVNFGSLPSFNDFNYLSTKRGLITKNLKVSDHIFACGDVIGDEEKIKRLAHGNNEANLIINYLKN